MIKIAFLYFINEIIFILEHKNPVDKPNLKMKVNPKYILLTFLLISLANLWGEYSYNKNLIYFTKPLLMPVLAFWYWRKTSLKQLFNKLVFAALIFSMLGDILLMLVEEGRAHFFLLGLGSFLITHIFYFFAFSKYQKTKSTPLNKKIWLASPLIIYCLIFNWYLIPAVPTTMQIPVSIYSITIALMALACIGLLGKISKSNFYLLFFGVLLFVISDSCIAINKFLSNQITIPYVRLWIMGLYILGQFMIVRGAVLDKTHDFSREI